MNGHPNRRVFLKAGGLGGAAPTLPDLAAAGAQAGPRPHCTRRGTARGGGGLGDPETGPGRARAGTTRTIQHGVAITPEGRYAFVTVEGVGIEPGTVEVYHVPTAERVGVVDVGKQAGGIAFWKTPGATASGRSSTGASRSARWMAPSRRRW